MNTQEKNAKEFSFQDRNINHLNENQNIHRKRFEMSIWKNGKTSRN